MARPSWLSFSTTANSSEGSAKAVPPLPSVSLKTFLISKPNCRPSQDFERSGLTTVMPPVSGGLVTTFSERFPSATSSIPRLTTINHTSNIEVNSSKISRTPKTLIISRTIDFSLFLYPLICPFIYLTKFLCTKNIIVIFV